MDEKNTPNNASKEADVCSIIRGELKGILVPSRKEKSTTNDESKEKVQIKAEYRGKSVRIEMRRPILFDTLQTYFNGKYDLQLNIYYTLRNNELIVPIRNQIELDRAITLFDRAQNQRSLHLLLSRHQTDSGLQSPGENLQLPSCSMRPDASGTYTSVSLKVTELANSECVSSCTSVSGSTSRWRGVHSRGSSSVSSGVVLADYGDSEEFKSPYTPCIPTHWKLGNCIGSGAFGRVYLCYDVDTGKEIALKKLNIGQSDQHLMKQIMHLENEINLLSTIQHNRIVQYLGVQRVDDSICIFMEYMVGGSVKDLISRYGPLSSPLARKYTFQVLQGLEYLHSNDMIHRDIKSANILRDSNGNVKIGDFGSAKRLQTICSQQMPTFIGTPYYMAPEVVTGETVHGRKADIWSVGCTLVEMLTGKPPWYDLEPMAAIYNIARKHPDFKLPPSTDPVLCNLLIVIFERNVQKRPSARDLLTKHPAFNCL